MKIFKRVCIAFLVLALIIGGIVLRMQYVFLDNELYKNDVKELFLSESLNKITVRELNRCSELELLSLYLTDNYSFEKMREFENLKTLIIYSSRSKVSDVGIEKINMLPNLDKLYFDVSDVNFSGINNDSLKSVYVLRGNITNIQELANCPSLAECWLTEATIGGKLYSIDNTDPSVEEYITVDDKTYVIHPIDKVCIEYYLKDSSDFSYLDNVRNLVISQTIIEDISGFTEMESLETLKVTKGFISEEDIKILEDKGINVIEESR